MFFLSRTFQRTFSTFQSTFSTFQGTLPTPDLVRPQSTLLLAEHDNSRLSPVTLYAITLAGQLGGEVHCLVAGTGCGEVVKELVAAPGIAKVLLADNAAYKDFLPEQLAPVMISAQSRFKFSHIVAGASTFSHSVMFPVAALLDVPVIPNIMWAKDADTFVRMVYGSNAVLTLKSVDPVKMMTLLMAPATTCTCDSCRELLER